MRARGSDGAHTLARVRREEGRDDARRQVAERGLTPAAVAHLTHDALGRIDLEHLAPVKTLLKRYFSSAPWTPDDDRALADLVGPGTGWWRHRLDEALELRFGWHEGVFRLDVSGPADDAPDDAPGDPGDDPAGEAAGSLAETFEGSVVPEATPNPRTIRFVTGPIHQGPSRWYESAEGVDDHRVRQIFRSFDDVANVLVGPDFVAVGLRRPDRWEHLLAPVLRQVATLFSPAPPAASSDPSEPTGGPAQGGTTGARRSSSGPTGSRRGAIDRAWQEIGHLRPDRPDDLAHVVDAASAPDPATRQVAARLLVGADPEDSAETWQRLLDDTSRAVRRATVDAIVDAAHPRLRPLLERALVDDDAWTRWKALRGLVELGIEPSRGVVTPLAQDRDFRVRLEAAGALRAR